MCKYEDINHLCNHPLLNQKGINNYCVSGPCSFEDNNIKNNDKIYKPEPIDNFIQEKLRFIITENEFTKELVNYLKYIRFAYHLNQKDFAERLDMTQQQYSRYESGKRQLPIYYLYKILALYEVHNNTLHF